jgi:hypothetical protein
MITKKRILLIGLTAAFILAVALIMKVNAEAETIGDVYIIGMQGKHREDENGNLQNATLYFVMGLPHDNEKCKQGRAQAVVSIRHWPKWGTEIARNDEVCGPVDLRAMKGFATILMWSLRSEERNLSPDPLGKYVNWQEVIRISQEEILYFRRDVAPAYQGRGYWGVYTPLIKRR